MDEFLEVVPGGRWTLAVVALLAVPGVRRQLRPVAKAAVRAGIAVTDQVKEMMAEAREQASDIVAEVRAERDAHENGAEPEGARSRRGRHAGSASASEA